MPCIRDSLQRMIGFKFDREKGGKGDEREHQVILR
jgi:hypothetical protein